MNITITDTQVEVLRGLLGDILDADWEFYKPLQTIYEQLTEEG